MTKKRYTIPADICRCEVEVNRSRFIATIEMTDSPEAALEFIARIKHEFPDANHNCWAYLIGLREVPIVSVSVTMVNLTVSPGSRC